VPAMQSVVTRRVSKLKSEFIMAINQICSERNLPQEVILEAIESALVSAYKRNFGSGQNIKASIDTRTGEPSVFLERIVVDQVEDERFEISLKEARKAARDAELGMLVQTDVTPQSFGRIAAQTAKQVILQRIREAERDALYSSYVDREGELINGVVANVTSQAVTLNLGRTEAIMPRSQQVPRERYRIGQRVRAYVMEVRKTSRGPQIIVSRTHRHMLRRLLELEVPEIYNGTVEIKGIAREAGSRSKVAVAALQEGVDPVGSCVGVRGMRIQSIVNELGGEKIDVVQWSPDTSTLIANALSPAKVNYAVLNEEGNNGKTATVVVPDDQLSLAIGKEGQNARLAAKLTGWRIDIKSQSEAQSEDLQPGGPVISAASKQRDILAMAEAILLGKEPVRPVKAPAVAAEDEETEPEVEEQVVAEVQPEAEELAEPVEEEPVQALEEEAPVEAETPVLAAADQVLEAEAPVEEAALEAEVSSSLEAEVEELAEPVEEELVSPQPRIVREIRPGDKPETKKPAKKPKYEYVEDEELESLKSSGGKSRRRRRGQLVRDEETGQLVRRRKHKREDGTEEYDW
jgi:N utilization substance protein A